MTTTLKYPEATPEDQAFFTDFENRIARLSRDFGKWDACDPVVHALLDLIEAQNNLATAIGDDDNLKATTAAREEAIAKLPIAVQQARDENICPYV